MPDPVLSVVIPTFNRAQLLERTLESLALQEGLRGKVEVIVVDDGSGDDTAEVVAGHPDVVYLHQDNAGPATARNLGWSSACGEVVAFTDDDTVPDRRWLADLADAFAADPGLGAAGGTVRPLRQNFLTRFVQAEAHASHGVGADGSIKYLVTANCAYRRKVLVGLGGFDETFPTASGEDTDLTMRARCGGVRMRVLDGAVVLHDHPASLGPILKSYLKHGRSWRQVVTKNPTWSSGERRHDIFTVGNWKRRYLAYRENGIGRAGAVAALGLRGLGMFIFAIGIGRSPRVPRQPGPLLPSSRFARGARSAAEVSRSE